MTMIIYYLLCNIESSCLNDAPPTEVNDGNIHEWYYYSQMSNKIFKIKFNSVLIWPSHGFSGTHFHLIYKLDDVIILDSESAFPTIKELKKFLNEKYLRQIKSYRYFIKAQQSLIKKIKVIEYE